MSDDDRERRILSLEKRLAAAEGEAMFAGVLMGPLLAMLSRRGALDAGEVKALIDGALLVLEKRRASLEPADQAAVDHARSRLEFQFGFHKGNQP